MTAYAELAAATNFSFLQGASHSGELVERALQLNHSGIGIADRNTVSGVVRAYKTWKDENDVFQEAHDTVQDLPFKVATGTRFCFADGTPDIIAYPAARQGWERICKILTLGNRRAKKGECRLYLDDLVFDTQSLLLIVMPPKSLDGLADLLTVLRAAAPASVWLGATMFRRGGDGRRLKRLKAIAAAAAVPLIAVNDVLYHAPERRPLQDVLTCVRDGVTIQAAGRRLEVNAERHLKSSDEMRLLFRDAPEAIEEIAHLLMRVDFDLAKLKYEYPDEPIPPGHTPQAYLEHLAWTRAMWRYGEDMPAKVRNSLVTELELIEKHDFARYFLTICQIVEMAQNKGILCQGRGSAANSTVCYVLGITCVAPEEANLLFSRFLSEGQTTPPDIDVDFEHERREEVIQDIYTRYGRERAGIAATVIHYRSRSAIRDVGKVLGLTEDVTAALANHTAWWDRGYSRERIVQAGLDPDDPKLAAAVALAADLTGFPRHLSQHVGGFVLTRGRLDALVPIGNAAMPDRTFIEWDRDDIDELALLKVDVLALGMLTCIRKCFDLLNAHKREEQNGGEWRFDAVPSGDERVYDMLCKGDSIGVFQVESRAQINMLPRMKPRAFYDLVIEVAIVRPGPIQGDMVHPYLKRRNGEEAVSYPSPALEHGAADELKSILGRTLGVPLFQEQAMQLAMDAAKFSDSEANGLRRAMATFRSRGKMNLYERKFVDGMTARGYDPEFAQRCFNQIKGFGEYGFPESHAASFAKLVYISSWLKCHHPEVFTCGLLNAQPMGFYAPSQLLRDAQDHGVEIRPLDVMRSEWDNTLEEGSGKLRALRIGFRQLDGFREVWAERIVAARRQGFATIEILMRRADLPRAALEKLAEADAFGALGLSRREALWAVRRLPAAKALPLFEAARAAELAAEVDLPLPAMPLSEHVVVDYRTTRLSLKGHPMSFLRDQLAAEGILSSAGLNATPDGRRARVAGVVLIRQRPGKGNAVFMTLEDETGIVNVLVWARFIEQFRQAVVGSRLIEVEGVVQKSKEGVLHLMADRLVDRSQLLRTLSDVEPLKPDLSHADEFTQGDTRRHPRNVRILPKSRDFH